MCDCFGCGEPIEGYQGYYTIHNNVDDSDEEIEKHWVDFHIQCFDELIDDGETHRLTRKKLDELFLTKTGRKYLNQYISINTLISEDTEIDGLFFEDDDGNDED